MELNSLTHKGFTIKIMTDAEADSPRYMFDHLGKMVCFHKRYRLGDKHDFSLDDAKKVENEIDVLSLPLYLFDHSGLSISTSDFKDPWDSGKVGFIYVTKETVRSEMGVKRVSAKLCRNVLKALHEEVEEYNAYLKGEVYRYQVWKDDAKVDECGGYYGCEKLAVQDAKDVIDTMVKNGYYEI